MQQPRLDVHQHFWSEPLVAALARRARPPRLALRDGQWWLELTGEPDQVLDVSSEGAAERVALVAADGIDEALLCLSSPIGIEALPRAEAQELLDAYHDGAFALGPPFGVWGAVALDDADPDDIDTLLDRGAAGVSLPAGALSTPDLVEQAAPLLERLERLDAPLLVHPGPGRGGPGSPTGVPHWWAAMTAYVADTAAAWHAFACAGRTAHPHLRIVFAMLAGGAPLHAERLHARGGPAAAFDDTAIFYDTSSYGDLAIGAAARVVGDTQLVYGSDRPVVSPAGVTRGPLRPWLRALVADNPARLLGRTQTAGAASPAVGAAA